MRSESSEPSVLQLRPAFERRSPESVLQGDAFDDIGVDANRELAGMENVRVSIGRASLSPVKWRKTAQRLLEHIMRQQTEVSWYQTIEAVQVRPAEAQLPRLMNVASSRKLRFRDQCSLRLFP